MYVCMYTYHTKARTHTFVRKYMPRQNHYEMTSFKNDRTAIRHDKSNETQHHVHVNGCVCMCVCVCTCPSVLLFLRTAVNPGPKVLGALGDSGAIAQAAGVAHAQAQKRLGQEEEGVGNQGEPLVVGAALLVHSGPQPSRTSSVLVVCLALSLTARALQPAAFLFWLALPAGTPVFAILLSCKANATSPERFSVFLPSLLLASLRSLRR